MRMMLLLLTMFVSVHASEDAWVSWWRRAEADLQRPDHAATLDARRADPPPPAAGGLALAHHRLLLAWLAGREHAAGNLAAVRRMAAPALRLLDPAIPCAEVPGAPARADERFCLVLPEPCQAPTAEALRELAGSPDPIGYVLDILNAERRARILWEQEPAEARRVTGLAAPPAWVGPADAEALAAAAEALTDPERRWHVVSPAGWACRWRVGNGCPPAYRTVAVWMTVHLGKAGVEHALEAIRAASVLSVARPDLVRRVMPALQRWADRRRVARRFGLTTEIEAAVAVLRLHLEDPPAAARADQAFAAAFEAYLRENAWPEPAAAGADDGYSGPPIINRRGELAPALSDWQALCVAVAGWAARNVGIGRRLEAWTPAEAGSAADALAALEPVLTAARDSGFHAFPAPCGDHAAGILAAAGQAIAAQRAVLSAAAAGEVRILGAIAQRDAALQRIAALRRELVGAEQRLALVAGAPVASFPLRLGLGEAATPAPAAHGEAADGSDQALAAALTTPPWDALAGRLIALHQGGGSDLPGLWAALRRRHAAFVALAARRHPDLDAVAADLVRDGAVATAAMLSAARTATEIPAPVAQAVERWLAAAARPTAGTQAAPPGAVLDPELAKERLLLTATDLGPAWAVLAADVVENNRRSLATAAVDEQEAVTAEAIGDHVAAAAALAAADLFDGEYHLVAGAYLRIAARPDPGRRTRYLAAARAWVATFPQESRP